MEPLTGPQTLADLADQAANILCARDSILDPDLEDWPASVLAELIAIALEGARPGCIGHVLYAEHLADHWLDLQYEEALRALPLWACDCGARYKECAGMTDAEYFEALDDGYRGPLCEGADDPASDADCWHESCPDIAIAGGYCSTGERVALVQRTLAGKLRPSKSSSCPACGASIGELADQRAAAKAAEINRKPIRRGVCGEFGSCRG